MSAKPRARAHDSYMQQPLAHINERSYLTRTIFHRKKGHGLKDRTECMELDGLVLRVCQDEAGIVDHVGRVSQRQQHGRGLIDILLLGGAEFRACILHALEHLVQTRIALHQRGRRGRHEEDVLVEALTNRSALAYVVAKSPTDIRSVLGNKQCFSHRLSCLLLCRAVLL